MSSVLDALSPAERAEVVEAVQYRRLERMLVEYGLTRLLDLELVREIVVPNPGAGNEWVTTVPAGSIFEVLQLQEIFSTSAVVANRVTSLIFKDSDGKTLGRIAPGANSTAGQITNVSFYQGLGANIQTSHFQVMLPTPPTPFQPGWSIGSITSNMDVADAYTGIVLLVREWTPARVVNVIRTLLEDLDSAGGIRYLS